MLLVEQTVLGAEGYGNWLNEGSEKYRWEYWPLTGTIQGLVALVVLVTGILVTTVGDFSNWYAIGGSIIAAVLWAEIRLRWMLLKNGRPSTMQKTTDAPSFASQRDWIVLLPLLLVVVGLILTLAVGLSEWYAIGSALLLLLSLLVWLAVVYSRVARHKRTLLLATMAGGGSSNSAVTSALVGVAAVPGGLVKAALQAPMFPTLSPGAPFSYSSTPLPPQHQLIRPHFQTPVPPRSPSPVAATVRSRKAPAGLIAV